MRSENIIFRVSFYEKDRKDPIELRVKSVSPSEFPGLVCFKDIQPDAQAGAIILPDQEKNIKKYKNTKSIHVPYHNIIFIEELDEGTEEPQKLAFVRDIKSEPTKESNLD